MTVALLTSPIGARKSAKICHLWIINATEGELWKTLEQGRPPLHKSPSIALVLEAGCAVWAYFGLRRRSRPRAVIRPGLNRFLSSRGAPPLAQLISIELNGGA